MYLGRDVVRKNRTQFVSPTRQRPNVPKATVRLERDPRGAQALSRLDVLSAVSIAHALLVTIHPEDVPVYEMNGPILGDEYLREIRFPDSWESLVERARALLGVQEPT